MKKYFNIICAILLCTGCDFLDTEIKDQLSVSDYMGTPEQLDAALAGVYHTLNPGDVYAKNLWFDLELSNDEVVYAKTKAASMHLPMTFNMDVNNTTVSNTFTALYKGIDQANNFLSYFEKITFEKTPEILAKKGEVLCIRALYYFNLVTRWGAVPLKLTPSTSAMDMDNYSERVEPQIIYDQIYRDLDEAITLLGKFQSSSHFSITSAQALKARVCLHNAGYPLYKREMYVTARNMCDEIINSGIHRLNSNYEDIFINLASDVHEKEYNEILLEIEYNSNMLDQYKIGCSLGRMFGIEYSDNCLSYGRYAPVSIMLSNNLRPDDKRRDWNIAPYSWSFPSKPAIPTSHESGKKVYYQPSSNSEVDINHDIIRRPAGKWRREYETLLPHNKNNTPINFPLLRYADVLLMRAEAENEINHGPSAKALADLKAVRDRAFGTDMDPLKDDIAAMGYDEFKNFIQDERMRELCFEGLRKYDLIRWGIFLDRMKDMEKEYEKIDQMAGGKDEIAAYVKKSLGRISEKYLLFPIPQEELMLNNNIKNEQNPGW